MNKQSLCSSSIVERFLSGRLNEDERRVFEQHLDSCSGCCDEIRTRAAEEAWWRDAREFLSESAVANDETIEENADWLSFLNPTDDPQMLGRFAGYEISGVIGRGGMGIVLKGLDASLNRFAAIKVLAPQLATHGAARKRFAREAQAAAAVVHDNVMPIFSVNEAGGMPYLVMPYVRGESLQRRMDREGTLSCKEILRIAMQIAAGLAAAHDQGLVHRDIKPANVLLPDGVERVMITDFGLARAVDDSSLTRTGVVAGTPQFMSPEQARGEAVDHRSDLFSLGSVMYVMCTGRPPFGADSSYAVLRDISDTPASPIRELNPDIPAWLCRIVEKLLAKEPRDRFQQASELQTLLEDALAHLQNPNTPLPKELGKLDRRHFRHRWALGLLAAACVVAAILPWNAPPWRMRNEEGKPASANTVGPAANGTVIPPPHSAQNESTHSLGDLEWEDRSVDSLIRMAEEIEWESRRSFGVLPRYEAIDN